MQYINFIRDNKEKFDFEMRRRGVDVTAAGVLQFDDKIRKAKFELQEAQAERNLIAKEIAVLKQSKQDASELMDRSSKIKEKIIELEGLLENLEKQLYDVLIMLPNMLDDGVPPGDSDADNVEIRKEGNLPTFGFAPKQHFELGEALDMMDFETAAKLSGSRFVILKKDLARLERALANFMLDVHTSKFGYTEISAPCLVNPQIMLGTGQLPKFSDASFIVDDGRFRLIPTAEVTSTSIVRDMIVKEDQLPMRIVSYSQCFRSEAGSAGRDTRGMIRVHQFSKVELVTICHPDKNEEEFKHMVAAAEYILQQLKLPYRVMLLCAGDTGDHAKKTHDLEVWLPGQNCYREISSCSDCGQFQAQRMMARFKDSSTGENRFVGTMNGSGLPIGRTIVAILENYQMEDGSIVIPEALRSYMGGQEKISK